MGCRANYVEIRDGSFFTFQYSHWGADNTCRLLASGNLRDPLEEEDDRPRGWLDDVFAEGGYLVDHDRKLILYFGHADLEDYDVQAATLVELEWSTKGVPYTTVMVDHAHEIVRYAAQRGLATQEDYLRANNADGNFVIDEGSCAECHAPRYMRHETKCSKLNRET